MSTKASFTLSVLLIAVVLPLALYSSLLMFPMADHSLAVPTGHFYIVSAAALLAAVNAVMVGVAGARLRNIQVTFLCMAYASLALIFALHGLSTPGFLIGRSGIPGMAAQLSVLLTGFWLWLSSRPGDSPAVIWLAGRQRWLMPLWVGSLIAVGAVLMRFPQLATFIPLNQSPVSWAAMMITLGFLITAGYQYWRSYLYSRFPLQAAVVYSAGLLSVSQVIITTGTIWHLSWWLYHIFLLVATVLMFWGLVRQYSTGSSIGTAVRGLFTLDPGERIEAGISPSVRALVVATETRDPYTAGHSYRVAVFALRLGEALNLPPDQLRALAQGAIVHDVGKIEVPDRVLNKPGRLDPEERAVIERHPVTGYELCKRLGFMPEEMAVIRSHHERWDGQGYPDRLQGKQIPLVGRIMAVADVYDALTSTRSYRQAWSHDAAMSLLQEEAGRQFDPTVVLAWVRINELGQVQVKASPWVMAAWQ